MSIFDRTDLAALESSIREARVLQHLSSAVIGGAGRPSVESALHAMLGRVVIHTHPGAANALNCGPGLNALKGITPAGELPPLWVPYTDPGWRLANTIKAAAECYEKEHHHRPDVIFMENHGLLVSAPEAQACLALHNQWVARCERYFAPQAPPLGVPKGLDSSAMRKAIVSLRHAWRKARGSAPFIRLTNDAELAGVACDERAETLAAGSLTPDHIVYTGARAMVGDSIDEVASKLKSALNELAPPRVAAVRNLETFLLAENAAKLDAAEALGAAAAKITRMAMGRGSV